MQRSNKLVTFHQLHIYNRDTGQDCRSPATLKSNVAVRACCRFIVRIEFELEASQDTPSRAAIHRNLGLVRSRNFPPSLTPYIVYDATSALVLILLHCETRKRILDETIVENLKYDLLRPYDDLMHESVMPISLLRDMSSSDSQFAIRIVARRIRQRFGKEATLIFLDLAVNLWCRAICAINQTDLSTSCYKSSGVTTIKRK